MPFDSTETTARDRLKILRDHIAGLSPEKFDMSEWRCGTAACIGGWTETLFAKKRLGESAVGALIGLNPDQSEALFYPDLPDPDGDARAWNATPAEAVKVLDHLLATGEVDWRVAF